jgi:hypothetical protein
MINTTFVNPPVPNRNFDWEATFDNYEPGDPIGRGSNEMLAVRDLINQTRPKDDIIKLD